MTLVSDIIRDAYRESNLIAISTEPSGAQNKEALRLLNRLLASVFGYDEGEQLSPYPIGTNNVSKPGGYQAPFRDSDWYVPQNVRLVFNLNKPETLYLSPSPEDGSRFGLLDNGNNLSTYPVTIFGNGHTIVGQTVSTFNTNGLKQDYIYRADLGDWRKISPVVETDEWPFPTEFDDMFVISLAMRLNPRNNVSLSPESMAVFRRSMSQFKSRYHQSDEQYVELSLLKTSANLYRFYGYDDTSGFYRGRTRSY